MPRIWISLVQLSKSNNYFVILNLKISKIYNFVKNWIMENILITPKNEKQLQLLKLLLEEMKIKFRYEKNENETINSELEDKINEARTEKKEGKLLTIDPKKIWESI